MTELLPDPRRTQVILQCKAVTHLATTIAHVHEDFASLFQHGELETLINTIGKQTASFMDQLGDMLNGIDADRDDDAWIDQIFDKAHRLWPTETVAPSPPREPVRVTDEMVEAVTDKVFEGMFPDILRRDKSVALTTAEGRIRKTLAAAITLGWTPPADGEGGGE